MIGMLWLDFFFRSLLPFLWVGPFPEFPQPGKWRTREYCASYYLWKLSSCSWKCRILQLSTGKQVGGDKRRNVQNGKNTKQSSLQGSVPEVFKMIMHSSQQSSSHYGLWLTAHNWNSLPSSSFHRKYSVIKNCNDRDVLTLQLPRSDC